MPCGYPKLVSQGARSYAKDQKSIGSPLTKKTSKNCKKSGKFKFNLQSFVYSQAPRDTRLEYTQGVL